METRGRPKRVYGTDPKPFEKKDYKLPKSDTKKKDEDERRRKRALQITNQA